MSLPLRYAPSLATRAMRKARTSTVGMGGTPKKQGLARKTAPMRAGLSARRQAFDKLLRVNGRRAPLVQ